MVYELQMESQSWTSKVLKSIKRHKFISTVLVTLMAFSTINAIMIYNFMKILQNL